jgi:methylase of polypeptide subunit release factors
VETAGTADGNIELHRKRSNHAHQAPERARDEALLALGRELLARGYRFTTITPATHQRVNSRPGNEIGSSLEAVFGWSRPFRRSSLPAIIIDLLEKAGELETRDGLLRSKVRFSSIGGQLFVHSAFPTDQPDAVFFGPDTYRFVRALRHKLTDFRIGSRLRVIDVGCGSGAGGLLVASLLAPHDPEIVLTDINARALRYAKVNAALNGCARVTTIESDLFAQIPGTADLIISNPPYLVDPRGRLYRHGGGALGFDLSLRIVEEGLNRLAPGGRLFLYTGTAVVDGTPKLFEALAPRLTASGRACTVEEIDPDVFGEELEHPPYDGADRIAAVAVTVDA